MVDTYMYMCEDVYVCMFVCVCVCVCVLLSVCACANLQLAYPKQKRQIFQLKISMITSMVLGKHAKANDT